MRVCALTLVTVFSLYYTVKGQLDLLPPDETLQEYSSAIPQRFQFPRLNKVIFQGMNNLDNKEKMLSQLFKESDDLKVTQKRGSVSWLLAAAIRMCKKYPAHCLGMKELHRLDSNDRKQIERALLEGY